MKIPELETITAQQLIEANIDPWEIDIDAIADNARLFCKNNYAFDLEESPVESIVIDESEDLARVVKAVQLAIAQQIVRERKRETEGEYLGEN